MLNCSSDRKNQSQVAKSFAKDESEIAEERWIYPSKDGQPLNEFPQAVSRSFFKRNCVIPKNEKMKYNSAFCSTRTCTLSRAELKFQQQPHQEGRFTRMKSPVSNHKNFWRYLTQKQSRKTCFWQNGFYITLRKKKIFKWFGVSIEILFLEWRTVLNLFAPQVAEQLKQNQPFSSSSKNWNDWQTFHFLDNTWRVTLTIYMIVLQFGNFSQ